VSDPVNPATPGPPPEPDPAARGQASAGPSDRGRRARWTPDKISAGAAVVGVLIAGLGVYFSTRGDDASSREAVAYTTVTAITQAGVELEGAYRALSPGEEDVLVFIRVEAAPAAIDWDVVRAIRDPAETRGGLEDGTWRVTIPVPPGRDYTTHASVAPAALPGAGAQSLLDQLRADGPASDLLISVDDPKVVENAP